MEFNEKEIIKLLLTEVFPEADNPIEAAEMLKTRLNNRIHLKLKHGIPMRNEVSMLFIVFHQTKSKRRGVTAMITFIIGMIVGAFIGVSAMAIVVAGKMADTETEELIRKEMNNESTQTIR